MARRPLIGISLAAHRLADSETGGSVLRVRPTYAHAVAVAGGTPVLIPLYVGAETLRSIYERLDGIVLSGGGDVDPSYYGAERSPYTVRVNRERDEVELQLTRWACAEDKPLLAICRGIQVLNVALGGTLIQDIRDEISGALRHDANSDVWFERPAHTITLTDGSRLQRALGVGEGPLEVNSLHHQALKDVATALDVVARASDGIVEGVEMPERRFIVGVQWHPETLVDEHPPMRRLFEALVRAAQG
ncbi:MAG TPA: gamma-glutamyl-gamma-aminobutyrate hydrolase family protein [Chloroflexi bacterium]|nr:gamma-glutamyl-gamma-aminobutyrate hydrolase family protein [Chloroflexota bacterium]